MSRPAGGWTGRAVAVLVALCAWAAPARSEDAGVDAAVETRADEWIVASVPGDLPEFPDEEWGPVFPEEGEPTTAAEEEPAEEAPWWHVLPIGGAAARERGYELPLPFGIGANFVVLSQSMSVNEVRVSAAGSPPQEVGFLTFEDFEGTGKSLTGRLDAWLLPFLNVYGVVGYTWANSDLVIQIQNPLPSGDPLRIPVDVTLEGPTYGGGATLVGGYGPLFAMADVNYTYTDFDLLDSKISKIVFSPRVGIQGQVWKLRGALWVGSMYIDNEQTLDLKLRLGVPALDPLRIEVDQKSDHAWNFLIGGSWEITRAVQLTIEGGLGDRKQLLVGAGYRF